MNFRSHFFLGAIIPKTPTQILHQCHLKSMLFNCIYGFDMLEQREIAVKGVLVALKVLQNSKAISEGVFHILLEKVLIQNFKAVGPH